ncbi:MAG: hypothetical protein M3R46_06215, partial [Actinomycetota bacterium]|nr:hypothetical protein [Actinomycetota bacterium]
MAFSRPLGRREREPGDPGHDRGHRDRLARAYVLVAQPGPHDQQDHQPERERWLDDGERREPERERLQGPAADDGQRAYDPAGPLHEPAEQR